MQSLLNYDFVNIFLLIFIIFFIYIQVTDTLTENLDISNADNVKELDQSRGVLSELHKLIQMVMS